MKNRQVKKITITALLAAICIILYFYIKFPLPIFPSFLEINFSMLPVVLGGYIVGPFYGSIIVVIRFLVKLSITHTAGVGEIADLLIGLSVVLASSLIYRYNRNKKGAIVSLIIASIVWVCVATLLNYSLLVPAYIKLYFNGNLKTFIGMLSVIPSVNETNYMWKYLVFAVIPFNVFLAMIVCLITYFTYKPLSGMINSIGNSVSNNKNLKKESIQKVSINVIKQEKRETEIKISIKK